MYGRTVSTLPPPHSIVLEQDTYMVILRSFAYLELFLSISQVIRNFRVHQYPSSQHRSYPGQEKMFSSGMFRRVMLPNRREWVAAVPTERLMVALEPRVLNVR